MDRTSRRIAEILSAYRITCTEQDDDLVAHVPVKGGTFIPVTVVVTEESTELYSVTLRQQIKVSMPEDGELLLALMTFPSTANVEMNVARCAVLPYVETDNDELEADKVSREALEDDDDVSRSLICSLDSTFFIGGLKQNHLKLLVRQLEAFVDDLGNCFSNFLELHGSVTDPEDEEGHWIENPEGDEPQHT